MKSDRCQWTPGCKRTYCHRVKVHGRLLRICWECWVRHCHSDRLPERDKERQEWSRVATRALVRRIQEGDL